MLHATADNSATIFVNGRQVAANKGWQNPVQTDVTGATQPGENILAVKCVGGVRRAGFVARLEITHGTVAGAANAPENISQRRVSFIVSDASWLAAPREVPGWQEAKVSGADWSKPVSLGKLGIAPWGDVLATRQATTAESLQALPGFKVELLRSARIDEGSWVSMTFDMKGRLIIAPDPGGLLRVTLAPAGTVAEVEKLKAPIDGAQGLLCAHGSLYVNNARGPDGPGFYRLRDADGDDQFDKVELFRTFTRSDHGPHAVVLGPDKLIYVMNGNFSGLPAKLSPASPHRMFKEDQLLPRQWDPNGHAIGVLAPGGYVTRLDPDGKKWELLLAGFRNPYDIAFNSDGEMFTYDADMEWDMGAPWYRPTRVNHCVSGGEYGWRSGSGKWPASYPDSLPAAVDVGKGSPTGIAFGTGAKFPPRYQRALFVLDWAYGKIFAVHLKPDGASYTGALETFLEGRPLNVTDVQVGPDGAMYFITGGWNTQSGLYRVTYTGPTLTEPSKSAAELKAEAAAVKARQLRHSLENFHGKQDAKAVAFAWPYLDSDDRWIRYAARIAIEAQPVAEWRQRALEEKSVNGGLTALLALARCSGMESQPALLHALAKFPLNRLAEARQLDKLRVLELSFSRQGKPDPANAAPVLAELDCHYPAKTEPLNRELCQLLIHLEAPGVVKKTLGLMAAARTQEEQTHYAFHLRSLQRGWTMDERRTYFAWFTKALTEFKGGNSFSKYLANAQRDAVSLLSSAQRTELAGVIGEVPALVIPQPSPNRKLVREWKIGDLLPDLEQVGVGRSFARGRKALIDAQCLACHQFGNEGGSIGPDLTGVAGRFGRRELLESLLEPSKIIGFQYENTVIRKTDGDDVTGKLVDEDEAKVALITNPLTQERAEVLKKDIARRSLSTVSPLPEGLASILTREEILDLLALLESGGRRDHVAFQK
ncbi:MAG: c-type cytochrome [Verrucomicrobia bacterium]|nr:c-type cytochrome [Verrucomicrobiota bacterium]